MVVRRGECCKWVGKLASEPEYRTRLFGAFSGLAETPRSDARPLAAATEPDRVEAALTHVIRVVREIA